MKGMSSNIIERVHCKSHVAVGQNDGLRSLMFFRQKGERRIANEGCAFGSRSELRILNRLTQMLKFFGSRLEDVNVIYLSYN